MSEDGALAPLLVLSDDWGGHPTSCQHLIRHLLRRHPVCWVNLIGMRRPGLDLVTLRRGWQKLRQWLGPRIQPQAVPPGLRVVSPLIWPSFRGRLDRWLNRKLLLRRLAPLVESFEAAPVAITTQPTMAELVGPLPVRRWVYYCVDDFGQWPGLDHETLRRMEGWLIDRADVLIAAGEELRARIRRRGRDAALLTHGVDTGAWRRPASGSVTGLEGLERPLVVFWGLVDRRLDLAFLRRLGQDLTRGTVLLVGPEADADPALARVPRLVRLPPVPFEQLPAVAAAADVLVMPYADLPVTRAMQPLKLKEYLATGKPVVARGLPATREWHDCLDTAATPEEFSRLVRLRLGEELPDEQHLARRRLEQEGWDAKAAEFARLALDAPLPPARRRALTRGSRLNDSPDEGHPCTSST
jgi:glycosyltransferase involved in cell wall biosynthesis